MNQFFAKAASSLIFILQTRMVRQVIRKVIESADRLFLGLGMGEGGFGLTGGGGGEVLSLQ